jgi:hypothetical protein
MRKGFIGALVCLLLATGLFACGGSDNNANSTDKKGDLTGNFLSWTGSSDASHFFTLVRVEGQTGTVTTIGGSGFFTGLAYGPDGKLYGVADALYVINPTNGATTRIGNLMYQGSQILMKEASFSPDGRLFVLENDGDRVFTVDLATGDLTLVGTVDATALANGFEFSDTGTLYTSFASLSILDASDVSTVSTLGSTGGVYISKLAFGRGGLLYGMDVFNSTHIYSLDLNSGQATAVTPVSSNGLASLVAERTPSVDPTAFAQSTPVYRPTAKSQDIEHFLNLEKTLKASHSMSK